MVQLSFRIVLGLLTHWVRYSVACDNATPLQYRRCREVLHIQPKVSIASIDVNIFLSSQFYYKHQMMQQSRLSRVVGFPSEKEKGKFNHNKNLKSTGKEENV